MLILRADIQIVGDEKVYNIQSREFIVVEGLFIALCI